MAYSVVQFKGSYFSLNSTGIVSSFESLRRGYRYE
jgi:hypothetical protein